MFRLGIELLQISVYLFNKHSVNWLVMVGKKRPVEKLRRRTSRATIEMKKDLIAKYESGVRVCQLSSMFHMPTSTICTIIKNKAAIKAADVAKGVTTLTARRSKGIDDMEKLLLLWINGKQLAGDVISEAVICEKAKALHNDIVKDLAQKEDFKASRGWFENFKRRSGFQKCFEVTNGSESTPNEFQNNHYAAVIEEAWKQMPLETTISKWMSKCVPEKVFDASESLPVRPEIVITNNSIKVETVNEKYTDNPPTETIQHIHPQPEVEIKQEISSGEEDEEAGKVNTVEIQEMLTMWSRIQEFLHRWHSDKVVVNRCVNIMNDNVMDYFRKIVKGRQHKNTLNHWPSATNNYSEPSTSGERLRYEIPALIPEIVMEDIPSSKH